MSISAAAAVLAATRVIWAVERTPGERAAAAVVAATGVTSAVERTPAEHAPGEPAAGASLNAQDLVEPTRAVLDSRHVAVLSPFLADWPTTTERRAVTPRRSPYSGCSRN